MTAPTLSRLGAQADQWTAEQGLDDSRRCDMLFRDPFAFIERSRCARPAIFEVYSICAHAHDDVERLCTEHTAKAGNGTYCNECATATDNPHACPVTVIDTRPIR